MGTRPPAVAVLWRTRRLGGRPRRRCGIRLCGRRSRRRDRTGERRTAANRAGSGVAARSRLRWVERTMAGPAGASGSARASARCRRRITRQPESVVGPLRAQYNRPGWCDAQICPRMSGYCGSPPAASAGHSGDASATRVLLLPLLRRAHDCGDRARRA